MDEIGVLERATGLRADLFTDSQGNEPARHFLRMKRNGDCVFLEVTAGTHSCSVYAARPAICREYPATHPQKTACDRHSGQCLAADLG